MQRSNFTPLDILVVDPAGIEPRITIFIVNGACLRPLIYWSVRTPGLEPGTLRM